MAIKNISLKGELLWWYEVTSTKTLRSATMNRKLSELSPMALDNKVSAKSLSRTKPSPNLMAVKQYLKVFVPVIDGWNFT